MLGEFWMIDRKNQIDEVLNNFRTWALGNWDWSKPLAFQAKPYEGSRSLSQNALFHVWMKEVRDHFIERTPDVTEEHWKIFFKTEYLGTETIKAGKIVHENQLRHTSNLKKGEMYEFMEAVNAWCAQRGLTLPVPDSSEFMEIRRSQA